MKPHKWGKVAAAAAERNIAGETHMTYKRGVSKGRPDISILVELTVLSKLCKKERSFQISLCDIKLSVIID